MEKTKIFRDKLAKLIYILDKGHKRMAIGIFVMIVIGALFETLGVSAILPFIQMLTEPEILMQNGYVLFFMKFFGLSTIRTVTVMIGISIIILYVVKNIYLSVSMYCQIKYRSSICMYLRHQMMESYLNHPYSFFVKTNSGNIVQGIIEEVLRVQEFFEGLFTVSSELLVVLLILLYIFSRDILITTGIAGMGFLVFLIITFGLKRRMIRLGEQNRRAYSEIYTTTLGISGGIKDILLKKKQISFLKRFDGAVEKNEKVQAAAQFSYVIPKRLIEAMCIGGIISVILVRIVMGIDTRTFIPKLAVFAVAAFRILPSMSRIIEGFNVMQFRYAAVDGVYDNIKEAREYLGGLPKEDANKDVVTFKFKDSIRIRNLCWRYEGSDEDVLRDLNLEVHKGEAVGIIGKSGAGKSTLADIFLGLYRPVKGTVAMDGYKIYDIPDSWCRMIGYVPQDVFMFDDTIRENVAFGETQIDDAQVWKALESASLKQFVEELPEGLDTMVGENGIKFSGGQKQRMAIARALYLKPEILLLDEATSALDSETELAVMEAIASLQGSITMIIIAHRLTTIRSCDRIYEIRDHRAYEVEKNLLEF